MTDFESKANLLHARHQGETIALQFSDGFKGSVSVSAVRQLVPGRDLAIGTIRACCDYAEVKDIDRKTVSIDSAVLRAVVDEAFRAELDHAVEVAS